MPRWVSGILPMQEADRAQERVRVFRPGTDRRTELSLPNRAVREAFGAHQVRAVCRSCNQGWMNQVETEARPALTPMLTGHKTHISAVDSHIVAIWAVKTAMVAEVTDPGTAGYHDADHVWLRERREPPVGTEVWAASQETNDEWSLRYQHVGFLVAPPDRIDDPCNAQMTTLGLGNLVLAVIHAPAGSPPRPPLESLRGAAVKLWPDPHPVSWPPPISLPPHIVWMIAMHFPWLMD